MSEEDLNHLCTYVAEYSTCDTLQKISPVKVDTPFGRKRIHTATFIKNVFTHTLRDLEIATIERKMSHKESECKIKLNYIFQQEMSMA